MTYNPIYCDKVGIGRKLRSRLNIKPSSLQNSPYIQSVPSQEVDDELVDQVIEQKENFLNLILNQVYELPLVATHPIITDIIESLVIGELIRIHFTGAGYGTGNDISGTSTNLTNYAYSMIVALTAGHNIYIPGQPPVQSIPGQTQPQPLKLIGETNKQQYDDTLTRQRTTVSSRKNFSTLYQLRDIDFEGTKPDYWYYNGF